jgi:hypothetical protein
MKSMTEILLVEEVRLGLSARAAALREIRAKTPNG